MCEVIKRYGDERTIETLTTVVKNIMEGTNYSLEKIFDIIKISEKDRKIVIDRLSNTYASENVRVANILNLYFYDGKEIINGAKMETINAAEIGSIFGNGDSEEENEDYEKILKNAIIKKNDAEIYFLLEIDEKARIRQAVSVRNILYDALHYVYKIAKAIGEHSEKNKEIVLLSTLIIFYGAEKWDERLTLSEMEETATLEIEDLATGYKIHLIQPKTIRSARKEAAIMIDEYTNVEFSYEEESHVNICEGIQGMIDDAVEEVMEKENIALAENVKTLMKNMNLTEEQTMEALGLSEERMQTMRKLLGNNG